MNPTTRRWNLDMSALASGLTLVVALAVPTAARAQSGVNQCGSVANAYGPFDYRKDRDKLAVVEAHHFTPEVEALIRGKSSTIGGDLDYTLRAFPNHHRALLAALKQGRQLKSDKTHGMNYTIECYFDRAIRFKSDDSVVRVLYAMYLQDKNRLTEAESQLDQAVGHAGENPFSHFNIGLMFYELKRYEKAAKQARQAQAMGFPRTDLIELLRKAGHWTEPAEPAAAASSAGSSPSSN